MRHGSTKGCINYIKYLRGQLSGRESFYSVRGEFFMPFEWHLNVCSLCILSYKKQTPANLRQSPFVKKGQQPSTTICTFIEQQGRKHD